MDRVRLGDGEDRECSRNQGDVDRISDLPGFFVDNRQRIEVTACVVGGEGIDGVGGGARQVTEQ
jgi:hypothetical protein